MPSFKLFVWSVDESFLLYDNANHFLFFPSGVQYYLHTSFMSGEKNNLEDTLSPDSSKKYPPNVSKLYLFS